LLAPRVSQSAGDRPSSVSLVGPTEPTRRKSGGRWRRCRPAPNAFVRVGTDNLVTVICNTDTQRTTGLRRRCRRADADWSLVRTEYAPSDAKQANNLNFGRQGLAALRHRQLVFAIPR
jgi:hypothetical protein